jgi:hypothetical protein
MPVTIKNIERPITGRCYCGASRISASRSPLSVAYCHCVDCRRVTGAPVAVFAEFNESDVIFDPDEGSRISVNPGVVRTFCSRCGSALSGRYDYLPGRVYIAIGLLDQADDYAPQVHAHDGERIQWLCVDDKLKRYRASARSWFGNEPAK